jgi:hypothetical protein
MTSEEKAKVGNHVQRPPSTASSTDSLKIRFAIDNKDRENCKRFFQKNHLHNKSLLQQNGQAGLNPLGREVRFQPALGRSSSDGRGFD